LNTVQNVLLQTILVSILHKETARMQHLASIFSKFSGEVPRPHCPTQQEGKNPYRLSLLYNCARAFGCWTTNLLAGLVRIKIW
jgi:hypothetical protein